MASTVSTIRAGSASRPDPESPPARWPSSGGTTVTPRAASTARLSWTAGCSHISVCMAGHTTTGAAVATRVVVRRSSANPPAYRASRSAVAGTTTTRSARWPSRVWGMTVASSHRLSLGRLGAEGVEGGLAHEAGGPLGEHRGHMDAVVDQSSADLDGLVRGDAGGHAEHDEGHIGVGHRSPTPSPPSTAPDTGLAGTRYSVLSSAAVPSAADSASPSPSSRARAAASASATSSGSGRV